MYREFVLSNSKLGWQGDWTKYFQRALGVQRLKSPAKNEEEDEPDGRCRLLQNEKRSVNEVSPR